MENIIEDAEFEFYRGDTYSRNFSVSGWSREITEVYFTVKENLDDKHYVLQKKLNNGITVADKTDDTVVFNLLIDATDTDNLKADTDYSFDVEIHSVASTGDIIKKTIITGTLRVSASATKTCNEK